MVQVKAIIDICEVQLYMSKNEAESLLLHLNDTATKDKSRQDHLDAISYGIRNQLKRAEG